MKTKIQVRRDTAANWTTNNPVLSAGEFGFESNTGKLKIGTGSTAWASLAYSTVLPSDLDELAQDSINAALVAGTGLDKTYDDGANTITLDIDSTVATLTGSQTLTNKTLSSPTISNPTFTGQASGLEVSFAQNIIFEGTTANDFETTLSAGDPTADRTITLPDNTGTVALTTDIPSTTDSLTQGSTNKYFSDELAQDAVAQALASGTHTNITVTYSDEANSISLAAAPGYVDEQAVDAVAAAIAAGTHTNISIAYNDSANSISFTGADALPSQSGNTGKFLSTDGTNDSWTFPKIPTGTTETSSPAEGQLFFNINANSLKVYSGGAWLTVGSVSMDQGSPYTAIYEANYDGGSPDLEPTSPVFDGGTVA
jgi:hypothetical protein